MNNSSLPAHEKDQKTVLVVDDEMDMRFFVSTLFKTSGYAAVTCRNGKEGFEKAKEIQPHLIILDVMMPGQGGALMYKELKTHDKMKHIPVIMLSGVGEQSFRHYLKMLNIKMQFKVPDPDRYFEKPPDPEHLLKAAKELIPDT